MPPRPFFVPGVSEPTKPLLSRPTKAAVPSTPAAEVPSMPRKISPERDDSEVDLQQLHTDTPSVVRTAKDTAEASTQLTSLQSLHSNMSNADQAEDSVKSIKEFARMELRRQFPYMKVEALEKLLAKTAKDLLAGIAEQELDMCAAQSRTSFFSLSADLRNTIYEMALKVENGVDIIQKADVRRHTALLLANRQVYAEAHPIWYTINTFNFDVGDPFDWPWYPFRGEREGAPEPGHVRDWLIQIGRHAHLVKSISLRMWSTDNPHLLLSNFLTFWDRGRYGRLTLHEAVLELSSLRHAGIASEVFTIVFSRVGHSKEYSHTGDAPKDLYEAVGLDGKEVYTKEVYNRLNGW